MINLNLKIFPPGSFERAIRLSSDPVQTALFRLMFDSLRIQSALDFVLRISMNISFCYRLIRVVQILITRRRQELIHFKPHRTTPSISPHAHVIRQQSLPRPVAFIFLLFSVAALVVTNGAITSSHKRCRGYSECAAYAYRWTLTDPSSQSCPCIALIDVDRLLRTFEEWENPKNATTLVSKLAASGDLRVLQLINRRLVEFPIELQLCSNLQHM